MKEYQLRCECERIMDDILDKIEQEMIPNESKIVNNLEENYNENKSEMKKNDKENNEAEKNIDSKTNQIDKEKAVNEEHITLQGEIIENKEEEAANISKENYGEINEVNLGNFTIKIL